MMDHKSEAVRLLGAAEVELEPALASVLAEMAGAHATLALLDAQRPVVISPDPVPKMRGEVQDFAGDPTRAVVEEIYLERGYAIEAGYSDAHDDVQGWVHLREHLLQRLGVLPARFLRTPTRRDLIVAAQFIVAECERQDREEDRRG